MLSLTGVTSAVSLSQSKSDVSWRLRPPLLRDSGSLGPNRSLLYRFASESGLRANEIRTLKVSSFDLDARTVTVEAVNSKGKRTDVLTFAESHCGRAETVFLPQVADGPSVWQRAASYKGYGRHAKG